MRYLFEGYALDIQRRELRVGAELVPLQPQVFDILAYLIQNRERVVTKDDLLASIWKGRIVSESSLTTRINAARNAIGDSGDQQRLIKTVLRKGVRFVGAVEEDQPPMQVAVPMPPLALPDRPSIAVLPFINFSADGERQYVADGIVEDIITELSRFRDLRVIARNSSFSYRGRSVDVRQIGHELGVQYVLQGSFRCDRERFRISAQLSDTSSGVHRWAEHFDRELNDIFVVQDEVARSVAGTLVAHIDKAEIERTLFKPPNSWKAYDHYLCAAEAYSAQFHRHFQANVIYETRRSLDECLAMEPDFARAHVLYSQTRTSSWALKLDSDYLDPEVLLSAKQSAETAVQLDPNLPQAHVQLGLIQCFRGLHDVALAHLERAIALNPNYADWRFSPVLIFTGHSDRAVELATAQLRIDPFALPIARGYLGLANIFLKKYSDAIAPLSEFVSRSPNHRPGRVWLTVAFSHMGDIEAAKAQAIELLRIDPNLEETIVAHKAIHGSMRPEDAELLTEGLRKAGLQVD